MHAHTHNNERQAEKSSNTVWVHNLLGLKFRVFAETSLLLKVLIFADLLWV